MDEGKDTGGWLSDPGSQWKLEESRGEEKTISFADVPE